MEFYREIRIFNRWYTDLIGLLNKHLLDSEYSLAEARLLFEIHAAGTIRASQLMLQPLDEQQRRRLVDHMQGVRRLMDTPAPPDAPLTIRTTLKPGDLGYIGWLHGRIYDGEFGYGIGFESYVLEGLGELGHQYDPERDRVWICEHGGQIVGFLAGVSRGDSLQLRYFILLPEYRGKGLGRRLMDLFVGFMRDMGYCKAYLWTTNEQHAAIALYTRYGFRLTEEKRSAAFGRTLTERKYELLP